MKINDNQAKQNNNKSSQKQEVSSDSTSSIHFVDKREENTSVSKIQELANNSTSKNPIVQKKENQTGLPDKLKSGIESLSGYSMDDVRVHYNSNKPAQLQAHAYAQGNEIHIASGQSKYLPHEAWHVVQQKQGRVKTTTQLKGKVNINDDISLEREADIMGEKASKLYTSENITSKQVSTSNSTIQKASSNAPIQRFPAILTSLAAYFGIEVSYAGVAAALGISTTALTIGLAAISTVGALWSIHKIISYFTSEDSGEPVEATGDESAITLRVINIIKKLNIKEVKKIGEDEIEMEHPFNKTASINIKIKILEKGEGGGDPVLLAGNEKNNYILFVSRMAFSSGLPNTIRTALNQLYLQQTESLGDLEPKTIKQGSRTPLEGEHVIEDGVSQSFQTNISPKIIWATLVEWLPGLESESLEAEFTEVATKLAVGLNMTLSASSRLTLELAQNWLTFNPSKLESSGLGEQVLNHVRSMVPKMIANYYHDKVKRQLLAKSTLEDYGEETSSTDTKGKATKESKPTQVTDSELLKLNKLPNVVNILKSLSGEIELQRQMYDTLQNKQGRQIAYLLNKYLEENKAVDKTNANETLEIVLAQLKTYNQRITITDALKKVGQPIKVPKDYLKEPEIVPVGPPTKRTIDNAIKAKFISRPDAQLLERYLGFNTAVRLITYYRKNNSMAAIRGLINQLAIHQTQLSNLSKVPPVTNKSLIIDTNIAKALLSKTHTLEEAVARDKTIKFLKAKGITDIRLPNMVVGELVAFGSGIFEQGNKATHSEGITWYPLPLNESRDTASGKGHYAEDLQLMEKSDVGGSKGAPDRQIVADALHAKTVTGQKPQFLTADKGIMKHLFEDLRDDSNDKSLKINKKKYQQINKDNGFEEMVKASNPSSVTSSDHLPFFSTNKLHGELDVYPIDVADHSSTAHPFTPSTIPLTLDKDDIRNASEPEGQAKELFGKKVGEHDVLKVKHIFRLIEKNGHRAVIAGGAVRDFVRGVDPNDIDITTDMHIDALQHALENDSQFKSVPMTCFRLPKMDLIKLGGRSESAIDITCSGDSGEKKLDKKGLLSEIGKRDFSMNALFVNEKGDILDPSRRGIEDALGSKLHMVADNFVGALSEKHPAYHEVGRLMKFVGRGYKVDPKQLSYVRQRILKLLEKASSNQDQLHGFIEILDKAREKTPIELIEILKSLGFSAKTIRVLFSDSPKGYFGDQTPAFEHHVSPARLENPETAKLPTTGTQVKVDTEHGRLYQQRFFVKSRKTGENLMIDLDMSNHGLPGHWAYHYHIYRWVKGKWDKHSTGMSASGEAGKPAIDGDEYYGPEPWTWAEVDSTQSDANLVKELQKNVGSELAIKYRNNIIDFGGEVSMHINKLRDIISNNQLSTLLMLIKNTVERGKLPDRSDMALFGMVTSKGERLRFNKQFWEVHAFLKRCNVAFKSLSLAQEIRLFDLLYYDNLETELLQNAGKWALGRSGKNPIEFTHYFEAYIALHDGIKTSSDISDEYDKIAPQKGINRKASTSKPASDPKERIKELKSISHTLHFASNSAEKYHFIKHRDDMNPSNPSAYTLKQYDLDAQEIIKNGNGTASIEQTGEQSFVFIWKGKKAVVKINAKGEAHIATAFQMSRREQETSDDLFFLRTLKLGNSDSLGDFSTGKPETPNEIINRRLASLESFLGKIQGNINESESGLRQLDTLSEHLKTLVSFFESSGEELESEYITLTSQRIEDLRALILTTKTILNETVAANTNEILIQKISRENKLLESQLFQIDAKRLALRFSRESSPITAIDQFNTALAFRGDLLNRMLHSDSLNKTQEKEVRSGLDEVIHLRKVIPVAKKILKEGKLDFKEQELVSEFSALSKEKEQNAVKLKKLNKIHIKSKTSIKSVKSDIGGVKNGGNTCYIASTLQIIANTPSYRAALAEDRVHPHPRLAAATLGIVNKLRGGEGISIEEIVDYRTELIRAGWLRGNLIYEASQQDAVELLGFILDAINETSAISERHQWHADDEDPGAHSKVSPIRVLSLAGLRSTGEVSLNDLIRQNIGVLTTTTDTDGTLHHRRSLTGALPPVITVQLNRFSYSSIMQRIFKLHQKITGTNQIEIPARLAPDGVRHVYNLTGFIVHIGQSAQSGHYISYIKKDDQWYGANDSNVEPVTDIEIAEAAKDAYSLTFERA